MENGIKVRVEWEPDKCKRLPKSTTYCTVARFREDINWPSEAWSILLMFDESPSEGSVHTAARASFLSTEGPIERMVSGTVFEMFEGFEKTATVVVL